MKYINYQKKLLGHKNLGLTNDHEYMNLQVDNVSATVEGCVKELNNSVQTNEPSCPRGYQFESERGDWTIVTEVSGWVKLKYFILNLENMKTETFTYNRKNILDITQCSLHSTYFCIMLVNNLEPNARIKFCYPFIIKPYYLYIAALVQY